MAKKRSHTVRLPDRRIALIGTIRVAELERKSASPESKNPSFLRAKRPTAAARGRSEERKLIKNRKLRFMIIDRIPMTD